MKLHTPCLQTTAATNMLGITDLMQPDKPQGLVVSPVGMAWARKSWNLTAILTQVGFELTVVIQQGCCYKIPGSQATQVAGRPSDLPRWERS